MQPVSKILEIDRGFEGSLKELGRFENRRIKINLNVSKKLKNLINSVINLYNFRSIWFSFLVHDSEIFFFFFFTNFARILKTK